MYHNTLDFKLRILNKLKEIGNKQYSVQVINRFGKGERSQIRIVRIGRIASNRLIFQTASTVSAVFGLPIPLSALHSV